MQALIFNKDHWLFNTINTTANWAVNATLHLSSNVFGYSKEKKPSIKEIFFYMCLKGSKKTDAIHNMPTDQFTDNLTKNYGSF